MISKVRPKRIAASFVVGAAVALYAPIPSAVAQTIGAPAASASPQSLDFEFFKAQIEPIFLKKRSADHARCYICHEQTKHRSGLNLESLAPGNSFWTEEQSRRNFQVVSRLVVPGNPLTSRFVMHPLAPEAGGDAVHLHNGGRQFESQGDPDWKIMAAWVRGQKAGGFSKP